MKKIILTRDKIALVDDEDYDKINKYQWHCAVTMKGSYSAESRINGKLIKMHRFILNVKEEIDHKDNDCLNNQKSNLRICTRSQNMANTSSRGGTSKYKGVYWNKDMNKWAAQIKFNYNAFVIGFYKDENKAALMYNKWAKFHFGEFAKLNEIELDNNSITDSFDNENSVMTETKISS